MPNAWNANRTKPVIRKWTLLATSILVLFSSLLWMSPIGFSQADSFTKSFKQFSNIVTGIDFFASTRTEISAFEKPMQEARVRLAEFLGNDLAKGAVVICSSAAQRDSVTESRVLGRGYRWALIQMTPEAEMQRRIAEIKTRMGGQVPAGMLERFQNQTQDMRAAASARLVSTTVQRAAYSILTMTLDPTKEFRPSRIDDMSRSPLADWLDIGLATYAAGPSSYNLRFLQDRLEEGFPVEDLLTMSRPFVAPSAEGGGGGGGGGMMNRRMEGGGGGQAGGSSGGGAAGGGAPQGGGGIQIILGQGGGGGRGEGRGGGPMPKDVQDRMMFDAQSASFFAYMLQKLGPEKTKIVIQASLAKKETPQVIGTAEMLGTDWENTEKDWQTWVKQQKSAGPDFMRIQMTPGRTQDRP